jgi:signal transduction histidine kinase/ligand-binding sensor protein
MLEKYQNSLNPESLLKVVPKNVLQSLMKGFFYGNRAGMVLMYKEAVGLNQFNLKRLDPIDWNSEITSAYDRDKFENFNPFCAKFRQSPLRNAMCENCDLEHANTVFATNASKLEYRCHMGLLDMIVPIRVGGRVFAVMFGGQKVISDDAKNEIIKANITKKAPEIAAELDEALTKAAEPKEKVDAFAESFEKFAESLQTTVEAFANASREEAQQETLVEVGSQLARSIVDEPDGWIEAARKLLDELEFLLSSSIWLLQRRGSRYQCVCVSESIGEVPTTNVAVAALIQKPLDRLIRISSGDPAHREICSKFNIKASNLTVARSDVPISDTDVASVVLVIHGTPPQDVERLITGCLRAIAYPAGVSGLFQKLEKQQHTFERHASFTGHHLKTPLFIALLALNETRYSQTDVAKIQKQIEKASNHIRLGLADALRLQEGAVPLVRERFDVLDLMESLIKDFEPTARTKGIEFRVGSSPDRDCRVNAILAQIRVALSNLIDNAIKYSFESKWIEVRFSKFVPVGGPNGSPRSVIAIEIEDIGVGFAAEHKEQLFSLGTRLANTEGSWARSGHGIGLTQAKEYIEAAGGSLDINSEPFSERKFRVTASVHLPS